MKIYIVDMIGKHCGMHYYINSFIKEIARCSDAEVIILSNFNNDGKKPFLLDHYEGNIVQKLLKFARNYFKTIFFLLCHRNSIVIFMNYGDLFDILLLPFICMTRHIIDVHEAIAQSKDSSSFHKWCFRRLYSRNVKKLIYHSDRTIKMLADLGFAGTAMFVPHFRYEISREYDKTKISLDVSSAIDKDRINILFFGNLTKEKGVDMLLDAINDLNLQAAAKINFIVAGKNIDNCVYAVKPNSDVNIKMFVRHISDDELNFFYSHCQAIAMPYRKTSQSGVLEMAFFHKLPVIATKIPYFEKTLGQFPSFGELSECNPEQYAKALEKFAKSYTGTSAYYNEKDYNNYLHRSEVDEFLKQLGEYLENNK